MFMRNRYNILFSLFWASLVLVGIETQAQENLKFAPNDIPVPWYSQKITGCPYTHCSLASSLMVFDYFKGMTADAQRTSSDAEKKLIEYQRNYFFKKRAPFRRRTSIGQGGYYSFEIDSLTRYYENMISAEHFQQKDYRILKDYIDRGIVLRGIDDKYVWVNDPGRSPEMRSKGENIRYPIKKQVGNPSYFDGCWTGRYIVVTPREWIRNPLYAQAGKLPPLEEVTHIQPPVVASTALPQVISQ